MTTTSLKTNLDALQLSDVYSLILFILYKTKDIPDCAVLSELCYLLDGRSMTRLLTYFAGKTITFPTEEDFVKFTSAILLYKQINVDGSSLTDALNSFTDLSVKQKDEVTKLYLQIIPIMNSYNINRGR